MILEVGGTVSSGKGRSAAEKRRAALRPSAGDTPASTFPVPVCGKRRRISALIIKKTASREREVYASRGLIVVFLLLSSFLEKGGYR
ncbi:MAG: hypothetical protein WCV62_05070 [Candidatus Peribacteraceae bacterium]|jgi:hypothetical protein